MTETKENGPPPIPEGWTRCCTYLEKKGRLCRQERKSGSKYCGNHGPLSEEQRKRVPCPIDPAHQIYEDQIEKHIKICPKITRQKEQEEMSYFRRDVNTGGHGALGASPCTPSLEWAQRIAIKVLEIHQRQFGAESRPPESLTQKEIYEAVTMKDLSQPEIDAGLADAVEHFRIKSGGPRHMHQQASLVGHLRLAGVLPPTPQSSNLPDEIEFLEMGAGRGMLGLVAAGVASACDSPKVHLTLVERAGSRSKADTVLRKATESKEEPPHYMKLKTVQWCRVQCDLAHIHVPTILESGKAPIAGEKRKKVESGRQLVVVAKHLCGAGTDLALKSLCSESQVDVCIMATCCHGVCSWNHYVGRNFLLAKFGDAFGTAEFELLRKWSTGTVAVCTNDSDESEKDSEHQPAAIDDDGRYPYSVTAVVRSLNLKCGVQGLGRACQRLLDAGRCDYMGNILFENGTHDVQLYHYVDASITPQNAIIVAKKKELHR